MKRLIEQETCEHGKFEAHQTYIKDRRGNIGAEGPVCPGGSSREVTVDELPYAKEAVELWHKYGLTVEFLEGMTYNHRVQLVGAAHRYCELGES